MNGKNDSFRKKRLFFALFRQKSKIGFEPQNASKSL